MGTACIHTSIPFSLGLSAKDKSPLASLDKSPLASQAGSKILGSAGSDSRGKPSFVCLGMEELGGEHGRHHCSVNQEPYHNSTVGKVAGWKGNGLWWWERELMEIVFPKIISVNLFFNPGFC